MKQFLIISLILLGVTAQAMAQTVNAPKIPTVNIQRLRTDAVSFSVRFQQDGANLNVLNETFWCEITEGGSNFLRVALTESAGITQTDSATLTISLTANQVKLLSAENYRYRLYTVSAGEQTTKLLGNFSLVNTVSATSSSIIPPAIIINYTSAGTTNIGGYIGTSISAGNAVTLTGGGGNYTVGVNYTALDGRYFRTSQSVNLTEAVPVATWAAMVNLGTPAKSTAYRVTTDENKNLTRTLYIWWADGKRQWIPALDDN